MPRAIEAHDNRKTQCASSMLEDAIERRAQLEAEFGPNEVDGIGAKRPSGRRRKRPAVSERWIIRWLSSTRMLGGATCSMARRCMAASPSATVGLTARDSFTTGSRTRIGPRAGAGAAACRPASPSIDRCAPYDRCTETGRKGSQPIRRRRERGNRPS